jgi:CRISPR/Cas system CSM-associated protein Csm2 small subunit
MLKAKVSYKESSNNVPDEFKDFISNLVDEIDKDELFTVRFDNACILMEALVAYNPNTK